MLQGFLPKIALRFLPGFHSLIIFRISLQISPVIPSEIPFGGFSGFPSGFLHRFLPGFLQRFFPGLLAGFLFTFLLELFQGFLSGVFQIFFQVFDQLFQGFYQDSSPLPSRHSLNNFFRNFSQNYSKDSDFFRNTFWEFQDFSRFSPGIDFTHSYTSFKFISNIAAANLLQQSNPEF